MLGIGMGISPGMGQILARTYSGAGVPTSATSGNIGDIYINTSENNRRYLKRWVGNFEGIDCIIGPILGSGNVDLNVEANVYYNGSTPLIRVASNTGSTAGFRLNLTNGKPQVLIGGVSGTGYSEGEVGAVVSVGWHKLKARYRAGGVDVFVDGTAWGTLTAASAPGTSLYGTNKAAGPGVSFGDWGLNASMATMICNAKVSLYGGSTLLDWRISEGSGQIYDSSGLGNNGTIINGSQTTFWLADWVPVDLL